MAGKILLDMHHREWNSNLKMISMFELVRISGTEIIVKTLKEQFSSLKPRIWLSDSRQNEWSYFCIMKGKNNILQISPDMV